jgi:hypothetical protein
VRALPQIAGIDLRLMPQIASASARIEDRSGRISLGDEP